MTFSLRPRRAEYVDAAEEMAGQQPFGGPLDGRTVELLEGLDDYYRALVAVLFNYVPTSGHPGGSISSGRIAQVLLFETMAYDLGDPLRQDADVLSYAAGHKALGLYALWALRNELARQGNPTLLPEREALQLRLEDLLGFRRNPATGTPWFREFHAKPLDGHPTPATPFVRLATGASGVGLASSVGLAWAAVDRYGQQAPKVHVMEGEGGLTPGRVAETMAAAGTAGLHNVVLHVDWNQASIDSDRVCAEDGQPGDYVQWNPMELAYFHDWNVVYVRDGFDWQQIAWAQRRAAAMRNGQPTAIVYRTVKGWRYGIEGRKSHGAGHKLCSPGFFATLEPLAQRVGPLGLPSCPDGRPACGQDQEDPRRERCFWQALSTVRERLAGPDRALADGLAARVLAARGRLLALGRRVRDGAPDAEAAFTLVRGSQEYPGDLQLLTGQRTTLRGELGKVLGHLNQATGGAVLVAAADLLGSTSISTATAGFPTGFWHSQRHLQARTLSVGGICEDAVAGILGGIASFGHHLPAGASYGAFLAPLGHIASRLHAIGAQARHELSGEPLHPFVLINAHAGLKTGEDGPTHADPQALQLLQENFPPGTMITLTPWDPQEVWPLMAAALIARPAVIAPFVTRPEETVLDRERLGLAPADACRTGVYALRRARGRSSGTLVLQGSAVTYAFVEEALPLLERDGIDLDVFYVASAELFDALPAEERMALWPEWRAQEALGITDFTLATLHRWVTSERGRAASLHPFRAGRFLGSGQGLRVLVEAGLDGRAQAAAIRAWLGLAPVVRTEAVAEPV